MKKEIFRKGKHGVKGSVKFALLLITVVFFVGYNVLNLIIMASFGKSYSDSELLKQIILLFVPSFIVSSVAMVMDTIHELEHKMAGKRNGHESYIPKGNRSCIFRGTLSKKVYVDCLYAPLKGNIISILMLLPLILWQSQIILILFSYLSLSLLSCSQDICAARLLKRYGDGALVKMKIKKRADGKIEPVGFVVISEF